MSRSPKSWAKEKKANKYKSRTYFAIFAAAICLTIMPTLLSEQQATISVMKHLDTGFDYDETLGRLQYVSNFIPDSAMVFLNSDEEDGCFISPVSAEVTHIWRQDEPWIEFGGASDVLSCEKGEIMSVVRNRADKYSVRVMHDQGYESVYSGLDEVFFYENDVIEKGDRIGISNDSSAFELRKNGLSIMPVFSSL